MSRRTQCSRTLVTVPAHLQRTFTSGYWESNPEGFDFFTFVSFFFFVCTCLRELLRDRVLFLVPFLVFVVALGVVTVLARERERLLPVVARLFV